MFHWPWERHWKSRQQLLSPLSELISQENLNNLILCMYTGVFVLKNQKYHV